VNSGGITYQVRVAASNFAAGGVLQGTTNNYDPDNAAPLNQSQVPLTNALPTNLNQDFGYAASTPGSISGTLWNDVDASGLLDGGEAGRFAGVTVDLYRDLNGNGTVDPGEPKIGTQTTDASGNYSFTGLATTGNGPSGSGAYVVDVTDTAGVLTGWWHSLGANQTADGYSKYDPYRVSISSDSPNNNTADFGYYIKPAGLGNWVWLDTNNNGQQDSGEPGMAGVKVTLTITWPYGGDPTVMTTFTDANGYYSFGNLLLDEDFDGVGTGEPTFSLTVTRPLGYQPGIVGVGDPALDSNPHSNAPASTTKGRTDDTYDFNYVNNPAAVLLDNYQAVTQPDHVLVTWETVSEVSNGGFNLYRALTVDGERTLLASEPSKSPGGTSGAAYSYQDFDVQPDHTYWYYLEDLDLSGLATLHGPVSVVFPGPVAVTLSALKAEAGQGAALWVVALAVAALLAAATTFALRRRVTL